MTIFKGREREVALLLLKDRWSALLEKDPTINNISATVKQHIIAEHKVSREEAVKILVELNCQALREIADQLEETAAAFLESISKT